MACAAAASRSAGTGSHCAASSSRRARSVDGSGTFDYAKGAYSGTFTVDGKTVRVAWTQATPLASATVDGAAVSVPAP